MLKSVEKVGSRSVDSPRAIQGYLPSVLSLPTVRAGRFLQRGTFARRESRAHDGLRGILLLSMIGHFACSDGRSGDAAVDAGSRDALLLSEDASGSAADAGPSRDGGTTPPDSGGDAGSSDLGGPNVESEGLDEQTNDDFDSAEDLAIGSAIEGTVGNPVGGVFDLDVFRFEASAGDIIKVSLAPKSGSTLQSSFSVTDPLFAYQRDADGAGDVVPISREMCLDETGVYGVLVSDGRNFQDPPENVGGASFTYTLSIERVSPPVEQVTLPVTRRAGRIDAAGTLPIFEFSGTRGDRVVLEVFASRLAPASDVDTILLLEDLTGTSTAPIIAAHDDIDGDAGNTDSRLDVLLRSSGPHRAILDYFSISGPERTYEISIGSSNAALGHLVINEVDYDNVGPDAAEFVELYNGSATAVPLGSLALIFVNGATGSEYRRVGLGAAASSLAPGAYLAVAMSTVAVDPSAIILRDEGAAQNGAPDGVVLFDLAAGVVIDALSYEGEVRQAMLTGVTGARDLVEGVPAPAADSDTVEGSLSRCPNGSDSDDAASDWMFLGTPTPGSPNACP